MAETIISTEYSSEMQQAYINYSMSVITSRAVPDVRDGLKPVQRRVLYAMNELGLNADKPHRKSARIVGDTMGKYHPHGDSSIYESLVVLSQDFKKGMALVDGHGNFGSIEGDGAAAMRYTEARLKKFTQEVYLADLDKNVVDFVSNFDETEKEPEVLPVRIPNLLVNGAEGIAVGMTTSIPTHNLIEVIEGMELLIQNPDVTTEELMTCIKGPDFPTGGIVTNQSELKAIYETGKGKIKLRGKAVIEKAEKKSEKDRIVITEIPYTMVGANIGKFLSDVATLVETKKIPDITDISNQSSKEGIKIVLELRKGADANKVLQGLYKKTKLEDTFGVNMLAIVNGKPEVLSLKKILEHNLAFQVELNTRKYTSLLEKEIGKKEIQEGLMKAVDIIDLIIELIRGSKTLKVAKECLITGNVEGINFKTEESRKQASKLCFTERQATAILELRLSKLIGLEILALQKEYEDTLKKIKKYEKILGSRKVMLQTITDDLIYIKKSYGLERRTTVDNVAEAVFEETPIVEQDVVFVMNRFGYVKTLEKSLFEKNEEAVRQESKIVLFCKNTSRIYIFTKNATVHQIKVIDIPLCKMKDKGIPIDNISNFDSSKEDMLLIEAGEQLHNKKLLFATKKAMIKQVPMEEFLSNKKTIVSTKLAEDDELLKIEVVTGDQVVLVTEQKKYLKFLIDNISTMKKVSVGVRGCKLEDGDLLKDVILFHSEEKTIVKIGNKKVDVNELKLKKRDGKIESL